MDSMPDFIKDLFLTERAKLQKQIDEIDQYLHLREQGTTFFDGKISKVFIFEDVVNDVNSVFGIDILPKDRNRNVFYPRCIAVYILIKSGHTYNSLAKKMNMTHATLINAVKKFERLSKFDVEFISFLNKYKKNGKYISNV